MEKNPAITAGDNAPEQTGQRPRPANESGDSRPANSIAPSPPGQAQEGGIGREEFEAFCQRFSEGRNDINNCFAVMMALAEISKRNPARYELLLKAVRTRAPQIIEELQEEFSLLGGLLMRLGEGELWQPWEGDSPVAPPRAHEGVIAREILLRFRDYFRDVKHDVNNSLAVVMSLSELAQRDPAHNEKVSTAVLRRFPEFVEMLADVNHRLRELPDGTATRSWRRPPPSPPVPPPASALPLRSLDPFSNHPVTVQWLGETLETLAENNKDARRGVAVELDRPSLAAVEGIPWLVIPALFSKAVAEVLANARQYSYANTTVQMALCRREDDGLELRIINRGIPLLAEDIPHLAAPGWRGAAGCQVRGDGSGMGLTNAVRAWNQLGGEIAFFPTGADGLTVVALRFSINPPAV